MTTDFPILRFGETQAVTLDELDSDIFGLRQRVPRASSVVVAADHAVIVAAAFAALDGWASTVELRGTYLVGGKTGGAVTLDDRTIFEALRGAKRPTNKQTHFARNAIQTTWVLFSSGTTGKPTKTGHTMSSLGAMIHRSNEGGSASAPRRWGLLYPPTRMAGVQVILQSIIGRETLVDVTHLRGIRARIQALVAAEVNSLSATPTLWRQILQVPDFSNLRLRQITLGGEIVPQALLDALASRFGARVTNVYASTEAGVVLSVSDGREGFPSGWLRERPEPTLQVRGGVLYVYAPASSAAGVDGFVCTDDMVRVVGERVHFLGRASGLVNVGGEKVSAEEVETMIRCHPSVIDAVVFPRRNPFSGEILVAQVVIDPATSPEERDSLAATLREWVAERLTRAHVPAHIRIVDHLDTSETGKVMRS